MYAASSSSSTQSSSLLRCANGLAAGVSLVVPDAVALSGVLVAAPKPVDGDTEAVLELNLCAEEEETPCFGLLILD